MSNDELDVTYHDVRRDAEESDSMSDDELDVTHHEVRHKSEELDSILSELLSDNLDVRDAKTAGSLRSKSSSKRSGTSYYIPGITERARCLESTGRRTRSNDIPESVPMPSREIEKSTKQDVTRKRDSDKNNGDKTKKTIHNDLPKSSSYYIPGITERSRHLRRNVTTRRNVDTTSIQSSLPSLEGSTLSSDYSA